MQPRRRFFCCAAGLSADAIRTQQLATALFDDDTEAVRRYLAAGGDPNIELNEHGKRPLHEVHSAQMATLLLEAGADVHATSHYGDVAIFYGSAEVVQVLLAAGADATARGRFGQTALLHWREPAAIRLLLAAGADPHAQRSGDTTLHYAGCAENVCLYTQLGLDANARNIIGDTPLFSVFNSPAAVKALLEAGADPNARNNDGATPLHGYSCAECAAELLAAGADVNAVDSRGCTPLNYAYQRNKGPKADKRALHLISTLLAAGARRGQEL